jgi:aryl-alcohol dehydrogenase (NADP+)
VRLSDELLDAIDAIVPPGTETGPLEANYQPPAIKTASLRRRPPAERAAG